MADSIHVRISGVDELDRKLAKIKGDIKPEVLRTTKKAVQYLHGQVPGYPPPPPLSTYRRTGTLGRSLTAKATPTGTGAVGRIGTVTSYAPDVISDEAVGGRGPQAPVHRGRWYTLQGVVRSCRAAVIGFYEEMVRKLVS